MTTKLMSKTLQAISVIASKAKEYSKCKFTSLAHLLNEDFLKECFRELKGGKSPGIDGVTVGEYAKALDENIADLVARLKAKQYKPQLVLHIHIPKPNGEKRPLGIPAVEDKIVQMALKKILEAIFEQDFIDTSYGVSTKSQLSRCSNRIRQDYHERSGQLCGGYGHLEVL